MIFKREFVIKHMLSYIYSASYKKTVTKPNYLEVRNFLFIFSFDLENENWVNFHAPWNVPHLCRGVCRNSAAGRPASLPHLSGIAVIQVFLQHNVNGVSRLFHKVCELDER